MIRAETVADSAEVVAVWTASYPHLVATAAGTRAQLTRRQPGGTRHHWVHVDDDGRVTGQARLRLTSDDDGQPHARLALAVRPDARRHGAGNALLGTALPVARAHGSDVVHALADDGVGITVAEAWGARRVRPHTVNVCEPRLAPAPASPPPGLRLVGCDDLPDRDEVLAVLNATADDDPSGLSHRMTADEFATFWSAPEHRPELGAAVLEGSRVLAFTSTSADLALGRAFTNITASRAGARGRGLATMVKAAALRAMAAAGVRTASTVNDDENGPVLAVNRRLGYTPLARTWSTELSLR